VGLGAAGLFFAAAHRASERRFRELEQQLRTMAEEQQQSAKDEAFRRPVIVWPSTPTPDSQPAPAAPAVPTAAPTSSAGSEQGSSATITQAEYVSKIGHAFSKEAPDPDWARQTEQAIGGSLRSVADASAIGAIECRRSLCKASLRHADSSKLADFNDRFLARMNELWTGEFYASRDSMNDEGPVQTTMYFAKPGFSIHALALGGDG
jgi:hypothetical protein